MIRDIIPADRASQVYQEAHSRLRAVWPSPRFVLDELSLLLAIGTPLGTL